MKFILIRPIITEASMKDAENSKFTFEIHEDATKTEVKKEVEKLYSVNVKSVRTVTIKRRKTINTKFGKKQTKMTLKKARVELLKGQMIPAFESKEEREKGGKVNS